MPAADPETTAPQLYLVTPQGAQAEVFAPLLGEVLARFPVACLRIRGSDDEAALGRMADMVRELGHAHDVAVVIEDRWGMAERHGLDGVHLTGGARLVREARKVLGPDAIVGASCGASRHAGMTAAEAGADYVSFGPVGGAGVADTAPHDLFQWWSEMIEVPVVAEGGFDAALLGQLSPVADFIALGREIWAAPDPVEALGRLWR